MSEQRPGDLPQAGEDLEYDLAHEAGAGSTPPEQPGRRNEQPVAAAPPGSYGDYSYDLAHEVRGGRREVAPEAGTDLSYDLAHEIPGRAGPPDDRTR